MLHNLKQTTRIAAFLGLLLSAYLLWSPASSSSTVNNSNQQCEQLLSASENVKTRTQCQSVSEQLTWMGWFKGESRSVQFHFIDLFELLFSSGEKSRNSNDHFQQQSSL